jgi:hypothetical protein
VSLLEALEISLTAREGDPLDEALTALCRAYARDLDSAAAVEARAHRVAEDVMRECGTDSALYERVKALEGALTKRAALDRIGARYQAALVELLATPRARAGQSGAGSGTPHAGGKLAKLHLLSTGEQA